MCGVVGSRPQASELSQSTILAPHERAVLRRGGRAELRHHQALPASDAVPDAQPVVHATRRPPADAVFVALHRILGQVPVLFRRDGDARRIAAALPAHDHGRAVRGGRCFCQCRDDQHGVRRAGETVLVTLVVLLSVPARARRAAIDQVPRLESGDASDDRVGFEAHAAVAIVGAPSGDTLRWKDVIIDNNAAGSVNTRDGVFWQRYRRGYFRYRADTSHRTLAVWKTSTIPRDSTL